jgi:hypothetical protein
MDSPSSSYCLNGREFGDCWESPIFPSHPREVPFTGHRENVRTPLYRGPSAEATTWCFLSQKARIGENGVLRTLVGDAPRTRPRQCRGQESHIELLRRADIGVRPPELNPTISRSEKESRSSENRGLLCPFGSIDFDIHLTRITCILNFYRCVNDTWNLPLRCCDILRSPVAI